MIKTKNKYGFILLFCILFNQGFAQLYNFKNYGTKNGLAGSIVHSIFQDSKGFMWFGTMSGVSRFDGKIFKNFTKNDGLVGNGINTINEDKHGNIWIGTSEGLSKFEGVKFTNYTVKDGLGADYIRFIFIDSKNTLWVAADTGGVVKLVNNRFEKITSTNGLNSNIVYTIAEDKEGNYWFGLSGGVAKYDGKKITNYNPKKEIQEKAIFSSYRDSKDNIWFGGTDGFGVVKYNGHAFERIKLPHEIENDFIGSITEDKNHNMWFATDHGALEYDDKDFMLYNEENGLSSNRVSSVCTDYENNIWIGTLSGGVDMLNNSSFLTFTKNQGLANNKINAVYKDSDNQLLVGTQGFGINLYSNNLFSSIPSLSTLAKSNILCITQNKDGEIWIGTEDEGVFIIEKSDKGYSIKKNIKKWNKTTITSVEKILFDNLGNTWLGSFGNGLFLINNKNELISFNTINGEKTDKILTLFKDSKQNLWIGTLDAGVIKYDGKKFISYKEKDGLANKAVWAIAEDDNHTMFFGTGEGGMSCFDGKVFKTLSTKDNLCSNYIETLVWDNIDKCLWAGTDKGVNKIKLEPDFSIKSLRYYGEREGFKGIEVNNNALYIDNKGLLWFGTINGLCCYNRKFDFLNSNPPKLNLNEILLSLKSVDWKKYADSVDLRNNVPQDLVLDYKNNHLTFNFKALTTDNVKYSYILEGEDNSWSPFSSSTEANFTNIAPGKTYTFRVKAVNSIGVPSDKNIEFTFTIKSPWWQTWWFYTIAILVLVIIIYSYINYRTSKIAKEKEVLEEIVNERTKELSESNRNIKDSITYAKRIQTAILPSQKIMKHYLHNSFILYKPKDIVSGDFYWFEAVDDLLLFAACDCTGHGVPGAMVSVVCHNALNRAVREFGLRAPNEILNKTAELVIESFSKSEVEINDGMDISLVSIKYDVSHTSAELQWAGANNPLWLIRKGEIIETKADKHPIARNDINHSFTAHTFHLQSGDKIYLFSDGYVDQFGGEREKKLTKKRFRELLLSIQGFSMSDQEKALDKFIIDYRKDIEQTDDILVMGVWI